MPGLGRRALLPAWMRQYRAPVWWHEIAILILLDLIYERLRNLIPTHETAAIDRGLQVLHFTELMHLNVELPINQFVSAHADLARFANGYYSFLHLPVTSGVLLWLFFWHRRIYRSARTVLVTSTILGLLGFYLVPMAPPRLIGAGFVDTLVQFHTFGSWGHASVASMTNQYAAMPSLHCAWALWAGLTVWHVARRPVIRYVALCYPMLTLLVVISTANHFLLDCVAGAAVLGLAYGIHHALQGRSAYEQAPLVPDYL